MNPNFLPGDPTRTTGPPPGTPTSTAPLSSSNTANPTPLTSPTGAPTNSGSGPYAPLPIGYGPNIPSAYGSFGSSGSGASGVYSMYNTYAAPPGVGYTYTPQPLTPLPSGPSGAAGAGSGSGLGPQTPQGPQSQSAANRPLSPIQTNTSPTSSTSSASSPPHPSSPTQSGAPPGTSTAVSTAPIITASSTSTTSTTNPFNQSYYPTSTTSSSALPIDSTANASTNTKPSPTSSSPLPSPTASPQLTASSFPNATYPQTASSTNALPPHLQSVSTAYTSSTSSSAPITPNPTPIASAIPSSPIIPTPSQGSASPDELEGWKLLAAATANARIATLATRATGRSTSILDLTQMLDREIIEWERRCKRAEGELEDARKQILDLRKKVRNPAGGAGMGPYGSMSASNEVLQQRLRELEKENKGLRAEMSAENRERMELLELNEKLWGQVAVLQRKCEVSEQMRLERNMGGMQMALQEEKIALQVQLEDLKFSLEQEKKKVADLEETKQRLFQLHYQDQPLPNPNSNQRTPNQNEVIIAIQHLESLKKANEDQSKVIDKVQSENKALAQGKVDFEKKIADAKKELLVSTESLKQVKDELEKNVRARNDLEIKLAQANADLQTTRARLEAEKATSAALSQKKNDPAAEKSDKPDLVRIQLEENLRFAQEENRSLELKLSRLHSSYTMLNDLLKQYQSQVHGTSLSSTSSSSSSSTSSSSAESREYSLLKESHRQLRDEFDARAKDFDELREENRQLKLRVADSSASAKSGSEKSAANQGELIESLQVKLRTETDEKLQLALRVKQFEADLENKSKEARDAKSETAKLRESVAESLVLFKPIRERFSPSSAALVGSAQPAPISPLAESDYPTISNGVLQVEKRLVDIITGANGQPLVSLAGTAAMQQMEQKHREEQARLGQDIQDLKDEVESYEARQVELTAHIKRLQDKLNESEETKAKLQAELAIASSSKTLDPADPSSSDALAQLQSELTAAKELIKEKISSISSLQSRIAQLERENTQLQEKAKLSGSLQNDAKTQQENATLSKEVEKLRKANEMLLLNLDTMHTELYESRAAKDQIGQIRAEFDQLQKRYEEENNTRVSIEKNLVIVQGELNEYKSKSVGGEDPLEAKRLREQLWKLHAAHEELKKKQLETPASSTMDALVIKLIETTIFCQEVSFKLLFKGEEWQIVMGSTCCWIINKLGKRLRLKYSLDIQVFLHPENPVLFFLQTNARSGYEFEAESQVVRDILVLALRSFIGSFVYSRIRAGAQTTTDILS